MWVALKSYCSISHKSRVKFIWHSKAIPAEYMCESVLVKPSELERQQ